MFAREALDRQPQLVAVDLQRAIKPPDYAFRECAGGGLPCGFAMRCKPDAGAERGGQEQGGKFAGIDSRHVLKRTYKEHSCNDLFRSVGRRCRGVSSPADVFPRDKPGLPLFSSLPSVHDGDSLQCQGERVQLTGINPSGRTLSRGAAITRPWRTSSP